MLINISGRTDIVNHYSEWMFKRFEEGYVLSRNSLFTNSVRRYELTPDKVDCIIFGSKNFAPVLERIHEITERFHTYFYYTITAYGKDVEPGVPDIETSIETFLKLSQIVGGNRIAWRYDPILLTKNYTIETHFKTFEKIAERLAGNFDRCIFSFVEMYKKLEYNMPEIIPLTEADKSAILKGIGKIAKKYNLYTQTCGTDENNEKYGIHVSGCTTPEILEQAHGIKYKNIKPQPMRKGCHCIPSRDIGAYDTCLNGCKYCYANKRPELAKENIKLHDKNSPLLLGYIQKTDKITETKPTSFIAQNQGKQISLIE